MKFDIDKMIKLSEVEIKKWTSFLKELKRQKALKKLKKEKING